MIRIMVSALSSFEVFFGRVMLRVRMNRSFGVVLVH